MVTSDDGLKQYLSKVLNQLSGFYILLFFFPISTKQKSQISKIVTSRLVDEELSEKISFGRIWC